MVKGIQLIEDPNEGDVFDLKFGDEGLSVGPTTEQNKANILLARPGDFKHDPTIGVDLGEALLGDETDLMNYRLKIRRDFALDGLKIKNLDLYDINNARIEAEYE